MAIFEFRMQIQSESRAPTLTFLTHTLRILNVSGFGIFIFRESHMTGRTQPYLTGSRKWHSEKLSSDVLINIVNDECYHF